MIRLDKFIFGSILAIFFPLLAALIAGTLGFYSVNENHIPYFVFGGLLIGIIGDLLVLKNLLNNLYILPAWLLAVFYVVCNIFIYGAFMGFPVLNLAMGIIAGYYTGRRIVTLNPGQPYRKALAGKVLLFGIIVMICICISSALIALNEKSIGEELKGMLGLGFVPGPGLIITVIIIGGSALISMQYLLTRIVLNMTVKYSGLQRQETF